MTRGVRSLLLEDGGDSVFRELRDDAIADSAVKDKDLLPCSALMIDHKCLALEKE
jgi:hypothetical protein